MAVPSVVSLFLLSHLVIFLHSAGADNIDQQKCPPSFNCGKFRPFKGSCELCMANCDPPEWGKWYKVENFSKDGVVKVRDTWLEGLISTNSCDLFNGWNNLIPSAPINVRIISPNLTLFICDTNKSKLIQQYEHHFRDYQPYKGCSEFTVYYAEPNRNVPTPPPPPHGCHSIQLPLLWPIAKRKLYDPFSLLAPEFDIHCEKLKEDKKKLSLILGTVISGGTTVLLILLILTMRYGKKWNHVSSCVLPRNTSSYPSSTADLEGGNIYFGVPVFSYTELQNATNGFHPSKELGDGGFGTVYHGKLRDGREVAVKRLYEHNYRRMSQFLNEIEILTRLRHRNLVSLYGCTSRQSKELLLVYEYIPNGTVADHLHGHQAEDGSLIWPIRMNIAIETASALAYLHASDIIHRDVKTNNILLDNNFCVKVADFGLSRLFPTDVTHVSTAPQGTPGYVDPEYHQCYQLTDKSDVYSFGVVLIELISSMPAVDINRHKHEINLSNLAINKIQNRAFDELIDPSLGFESDPSVERMITSVAEVAFRCLQLEKELRPSMDEVLKDLKAIRDHGDDKSGEVIDNVGSLESTKPPHSPDGDNVVLLKSKKVLSSPNTVTDKWISCSSTSISSG